MSADTENVNFANHHSLSPQLLLHLVGESYPNGSISLIDRQLKFVYTNGSGYKKFGINPGTFTNKSIFEVLQPEVCESIRGQISKVFAGESVAHEVTSNGYKFLNSYKPILNEDGVVHYFILTSQDITFLKNLEADHNKLQEVVHKSLNEIYILDPETFLLEYVNEAALKNLKYTLQELREMTLFQIKTQFNQESFRELIKPVLSGELNRFVFETTNKRSDGSFYPVEVHLQLIQYGNKASIVTIVLDISSKRQYELNIKEKNEELAATIEELNASTEELREHNEKLLKLLEEKESLFKELHHRIKNNLQMVLSLLYIKSQNSSDPNLLSFISDTKTRIISISLLHEHLLQLKSINRLDINQYLLALIRNIMNSYKSGAGDFVLNYEVESCEMPIDQIVNIGLITNEIISNIYKHAYPQGQGGPINVKFQVRNDVCYFQVSDEGVGRPEVLKNSKSYGTQLIKLFSEQLRANLTVSFTNGTKYLLEFKLT